VRVRVGRQRELPLTDEPGDLGPGAALCVQQRDPSVSQVMWAEHRHPGVLAGASDRGAERVRVSLEDRRVDIATERPLRSPPQSSHVASVTRR